MSSEGEQQPSDSGLIFYEMERMIEVLAQSLSTVSRTAESRVLLEESQDVDPFRKVKRIRRSTQTLDVPPAPVTSERRSTEVQADRVSSVT